MATALTATRAPLHRCTGQRLLTGSGPVIGSVAAVANGGHAKSRRYWSAPRPRRPHLSHQATPPASHSIAMHRQRRSAHPPAAACALFAFSSLLLVPRQQTLASSHWRSFSRAAWCSSGPETVAPSQLPRPVHRSLISVLPALPCRLQTDLPSPPLPSLQTPSHPPPPLHSLPLEAFSSWLLRGCRAGGGGSSIGDKTCPTALISAVNLISPAAHHASSVR
ncbi:hypothetical protein GGP41_000510 [Bipolaris sorokiniana]|uniref:Uncharacterized protein n=1 Tax=Cochliobolus sativus TaxID=45130 RepID=A0A8H5ZMI8_COCSA|nr:hypothetical protein GGP41_000510 [Bipolaris sorokiniana]